MKNLQRILIFSFLLLITSYANAQFSNFSRKHAQGMYGLEVNYGISKHGNIIELSTIEFKNKDRQQLLNFSYEYGSVDEDDYTSLNLTYLRQYGIYELNQRFFLNGFGGAIVGYETIKSKYLDKKKKSLVGGITLGIEIECYVTDNIAIVPRFQQAYKLRSELGELSYRAQIGVRYVF